MEIIYKYFLETRRDNVVVLYVYIKYLYSFLYYKVLVMAKLDQRKMFN
jgi:hypothetical protein